MTMSVIVKQQKGKIRTTVKLRTYMYHTYVTSIFFPRSSLRCIPVHV